MKVLGLVASPRKLGNSELIVKEMLASLPDTVEKEMLRLPDLAIQPCSACYACLPQEKSCVIHDDLAFLLEKIKSADAVIIASACYFLGSHTSIKTITDRFISVLGNCSDFAGKRCVTAVAYGIPDWEGYAREAVNNFARLLHLDVVGDITIQAASPGEAINDITLPQIHKLAAQLLAPSPVDLSSSDTLLCPTCGSSLLQMKADGAVRCVMCGMTGTMSAEKNLYSIQPASVEHCRFSPEGMTEHARLLDNIKKSYIANRHELAKKRKVYEKYDWWVKPSK